MVAYFVWDFIGSNKKVQDLIGSNGKIEAFIEIYLFYFAIKHNCYWNMKLQKQKMELELNSIMLMCKRRKLLEVVSKLLAGLEMRQVVCRNYNGSVL